MPMNSISLSLLLAMVSMATVTSMTSMSSMAMNNLCVVSNNTRAVVNPLGDLVALLGDNVLAVLNVGGVHLGVILSVADLSGDLVLSMDRPLLALPLGLGMALGRRGVTMTTMTMTMSSISFSFSISFSSSFPLAMMDTMASIASMTNTVASMTTMVNLGGVSNNTGAVVNPLRDLVAFLGHHILAFLNVGGVHLGVILSVANLPGDLVFSVDRPLLALPLGLGLAPRCRGVTMMASMTMAKGSISIKTMKCIMLLRGLIPTCLRS